MPDWSAGLDISDRENVETMYDSSPDLSLPNLGSGKKVISTLFGLLFVVARWRVIIAGLSGRIVRVACFTVERSGVKTLVGPDFEGNVHLLNFFTSLWVSSQDDPLAAPVWTDKDFLRFDSSEKRAPDLSV